MNINLSNPVFFCLSFAAGLVTCSLGIFKLYNDSVHNTPSLRSCLRGEDVVFSPLFLMQGITTPPLLLLTVYESRRVGRSHMSTHSGGAIAFRPKLRGGGGREHCCCSPDCTALPCVMLAGKRLYVTEFCTLLHAKTF